MSLLALYLPTCPLLQTPVSKKKNTNWLTNDQHQWVFKDNLKCEPTTLGVNKPPNREQHD